VNPNFKDTVTKELLPALKLKSKNQRKINDVSEERTSKFVLKEIKQVEAMLSGEFFFREQRDMDKQLNQKVQMGRR
jgi:hypothetical protein